MSITGKGLTAKQQKATVHSWQRAVPRSLAAAAAYHASVTHNPALRPLFPDKAVYASTAAEARRSALDMGLLHGVSTRVSWAAGGIFIRLGDFRC